VFGRRPRSLTRYTFVVSIMPVTTSVGPQPINACGSLPLLPRIPNHAAISTTLVTDEIIHPHLALQWLDNSKSAELDLPRSRYNESDLLYITYES